MEEIWKDIEGFEGIYQVCNIGDKVKSVFRKAPSGKTVVERLKKVHNMKTGYKMVYLNNPNGKDRNISIHRLKAIAFIPNPNQYECINHIDGNKHNNDLSNLEWCTIQHNNQHAFDNGLNEGRKGIRHHNTNLSEQQILEIRQLYDLGSRIVDIAEKYKLGRTGIELIVKRKRWKHIPEKSIPELVKLERINRY